MTESQDAEIEAIQAVVDRVSAYQDGAAISIVREELAKGFTDAGVHVSSENIDAIADAIESNHGDIDAKAVLGR